MELNKKKTIRKVLRILAITILCFVGIPALIFGIYLIYMQAHYYRIEDNQTIDIENNQSARIEKNKEYTISTYNIGFGAYSDDYSFFMDSGVMKNGKKVSGKYGKARSKEEVIRNIEGDISLLEPLDADFMLFQEVDTSGDRSHNVNQKEMLESRFKEYSVSYAINYHCSWIFLPITDPMGIANSGLLTLSKYEIESSVRRSLPISTSFFSKFTDLDRAINIMRYSVGDKEFVLINVHLSAYDKGGVYRKKQIEMINQILKDEHDKGNYVILGGDFNHDIASTIGKFPSDQEDPSWVNVLTDDDLTEGYRLVADGKTWGSCRAAEIPYEEGINYVVTVDGFIVSDNITVSLIHNMYENNKFLYSDHLPVEMKFTLA